MSTERSNNLRLGIQIVIGIFMMIGAWFANQVWGAQKELARLSQDRFGALTDQIAKLDKEAAVTTASRFTALDWMKASELITTNFSAINRRLDRHDDIITQLVEITKKIEAKQ